MKLRIIGLLAVVAAFFIVGCSEYPGFDETDSGLFYKIHVENDGAQKPAMGDYVYVNMTYRLDEEDLDTILFSSKDSPQPIILKVSESMYNGDINEALTLLALGDSGTFITSADSFFIKTVGLQELPPPVKAGMMLYFDIKITDIKTQEEFEAEMEIQMMEQQKQLETLKDQEAVDRDAFIKANNITAQPSETGLYYIEKETGSGAFAVNGNTVRVEYEGSFLNGVVFDASKNQGQPIEFALGLGQVIPGWEEGLLKMREGGKAQFIIPSDLAYGQSQPGHPIPPYASLVFDVQLVEIVK